MPLSTIFLLYHAGVIWYFDPLKNRPLGQYTIWYFEPHHGKLNPLISTKRGGFDIEPPIHGVLNPL